MKGGGGGALPHHDYVERVDARRLWLVESYPFNAKREHEYVLRYGDERDVVRRWQAE